MSRDHTRITEMITPGYFSELSDEGRKEPDIDAMVGIRCGDQIPRFESVHDVLPGMQRRENLSRFLGDFEAPADTICGQWKVHAKGAYTGDFQVKTRNPLLFVSNRYDPVTPLISARNMSQGFEGSGLLVQEGHGVSL